MNHVRYIVALCLLACLSMLPLMARATCTFDRGDSTSTVNISFANSVIVIDPNAAVGTVLASTSQFTPTPISNMTCTFGKTTFGVNNLIAATPGNNTTIFPTNIPGLGYRITHPDTSNYLLPYPLDSYQGTSIFGTDVELSVTSGIELIKTGPIANGATLNATTLGNWQYGNIIAEIFKLSRSVTLTYPACTVNNNAINVVLPTISNTAFNGVGTTAGGTAFNISLNCSAGSTLLIEFDTANPSSVANSVIANATGTGRAKNIGVQLTNQSFAPITFGTPAIVGTTPNGPYNLTYYARYYQTATATPTAGTVSTTATFTLTYQ
jgi:type 1 fimbria pilin